MAWCFFVAAQYKIMRVEFHRESTNSDWKWNIEQLISLEIAARK